MRHSFLDILRCVKHRETIDICPVADHQARALAPRAYWQEHEVIIQRDAVSDDTMSHGFLTRNRRIQQFRPICAPRRRRRSMRNRMAIAPRYRIIG
jgi:hypothetical protein